MTCRNLLKLCVLFSMLSPAAGQAWEDHGEGPSEPSVEAPGTLGVGPGITQSTPGIPQIPFVPTREKEEKPAPVADVELPPKLQENVKALLGKADSDEYSIRAGAREELKKLAGEHYELPAYAAGAAKRTEFTPEQRDALRELAQINAQKDLTKAVLKEWERKFPHVEEDLNRVGDYLKKRDAILGDPELLPPQQEKALAKAEKALGGKGIEVLPRRGDDNLQVRIDGRHYEFSRYSRTITPLVKSGGSLQPASFDVRKADLQTLPEGWWRAHQGQIKPLLRQGGQVLSFGPVQIHPGEQKDGKPVYYLESSTKVSGETASKLSPHDSTRRISTAPGGTYEYSDPFGFIQFGRVLPVPSN